MQHSAVPRYFPRKGITARFVSLGMRAMRADYNSHSLSQKSVWDQACSIFEEALPTRLPGPLFRVADYGCGPGANSLKPLKTIAARLDSETQLSVVLNDLPSNNLTALLTTVNPYAIDPSKATRIFTQISPNSFYSQILPSNSVDFGYVLVAAHWLQGHGGPISSGIHPIWEHVLDQEVLDIWASIAAHDWRSFLEAREAELAPGGRLLLSISTQNQDGSYPFSQQGLVLYRALQELADEGQCSHEQLSNYVMPLWYRTEEDVRAPWECDSPINLQIESLEFKVTPCVHYNSLLKGIIQTTEYAKIILDTSLAVNEPSLTAALSECGSEKIRKLISIARERAELVIAAEPEKYKIEQSNFFLVLSKRK